MEALLNAFEHKKPEIIFEWNDSETEAQGWVVINSLRGGAAGGGTRMRKGLDKREVESLAKTMEIKFTVSGPAIGGAKSGINFDPNDPRKQGVLKRWFKAVMPLLKNYYGTGGDLNVDEIHEVIPYSEQFGLWHPQEGVVNGHFKPTEAEKIKQIGQLRKGVSKVIENQNYCPDGSANLVIADMITGWGVAESIIHFFKLTNQNAVGKKVIIQGWGNVGAAAAFYLAKAGLLIVGIIDSAGGIIEPQGLSYSQVNKLYVNKAGNKLVAANMLSFEKANEQIWDVQTDVFVPAAASRLVTQNQIDRLIQAGLSLVSCGANVPFADEAIFFGPIAKSVDERISLIPDFIANCGMARAFAYLMQTEAIITDEAIFDDVSAIISHALQPLLYKNDQKQTDLTKNAFEIALNQLI